MSIITCKTWFLLPHSVYTILYCYTAVRYCSAAAADLQLQLVLEVDRTYAIQHTGQRIRGAIIHIAYIL